MKTIQTTTYEHDVNGDLCKEVVITEEIPGGDFLRLDGLNQERIADLVRIRDAMLAAEQ